MLGFLPRTGMLLCLHYIVYSKTVRQDMRAQSMHTGQDLEQNMLALLGLQCSTGMTICV